MTWYERDPSDPGRAVLFNTLDYAGFFAAVFIVSWTIARLPRLRLFFLLAASYAFYAAWDWRYLPLIFLSSTVDYFLARAIAREEHPGRRRALLVGTVALNLGFLGFFKYWNFGVDNARTLAERMGVALEPVYLEMALPVGISFFTFESMSYVIDVYRRHLEPHRSYPRYLLFVAFFPHLVAGPIVRPRDLLPQLAATPSLTREQGSEALFLIASGLVKKVVVGDHLAVNLVDRVFERPENFSALENLAAVYGYAIQIYCDFSGYTDIAIGSALLLGVRFPPNFDAPYQAASVSEFWRRWHISLSTWLRDYLYVPLGGNRKGAARTYVNLMITMLLGGLWHGASWNFVVWGGLHGGALAATRAWERARPARSLAASERPRAVVHALKVLLTFHFVCFAWIFFRAGTFEHALLVLRQLATFTTFHPNLPLGVVAVLVAGLVGIALPRALRERARAEFSQLPAPAQGVCLFAVAVLLREAAETEAVPFIYFQF